MPLGRSGHSFLGAAFNAGSGCYCPAALSIGADWGCDHFMAPDFLPLMFVEDLLLLMMPTLPLFP
jgi:hypothetical protein